MTVTSNRESRVIVSASGFSNPIDLDQYVEDASHLKVYADATLLDYGVEWTVAGLLDDTGVEVTITATGLANYSPTNWVVYHEPPVEQGANLSLGGRFGLAYEQALDATTRRNQSLEDRVNRGLRLPVDTPLDASVAELPSALPDSVFGWNADGTAIENKGTLPDITGIADLGDEIVTLAGISANITTVAGISANVTTVAGVSAAVSTLAPIAANITTVAGISANVTTVAGVSAAVSTLAPIATDITTVANNMADINAAVADLPSLAAKANIDGSNISSAAQKSTFRIAVGLSPHHLCLGMPTLTTAVPITTSDVTGAATLYFTPYKGNVIWLYAAAIWQPFTFTELSIALSAGTASRPHDVFAYSNSGVPTLELLAWTNDTTRATALALQDGIRVKSGDPTRRYITTLYLDGSKQCTDSYSKRNLWREGVERPLTIADTTSSWTYTTAAYRQARANAANQLEWVSGEAELVKADINVSAFNTSTGVLLYTGFGLDGTTGITGGAVKQGPAQTAVANQWVAVPSSYLNLVAAGRHTLAWLEWSAASGTTTWGGSPFGSVAQMHGLIGGGRI